MIELPAMIWIESRKAIRSGLPVWTALGSLFMPLGIAFLLFVARNPDISDKLGLISAKADLLMYADMDWPGYLVLFGQLFAAGGFFLFVLVISWVFGREFTDGTLKDLLAVPAPRGGIVLAKFIVTAAWCAFLAVVMCTAGMLLGALLHLPGASLPILQGGSLRVLATASLVIVSVLPFAFFASLGRGYLLPLAMAVLVLMAANIAAVIGYAEYFPWTVPVLCAQAESAVPLISYMILFFTSLGGMFITYLWWKFADQSR